MKFISILSGKSDDPLQAVRMRLPYMASGSSIMAITVLLACYEADVISGTIFFRCSGLIVLAMISFYMLFRYKINRRFRDPSLTLAQMLVATTIILYAMYEAKKLA